MRPRARIDFGWPDEDEEEDEDDSSALGLIPDTDQE